MSKQYAVNSKQCEKRTQIYWLLLTAYCLLALCGSKETTPPVPGSTSLRLWPKACIRNRVDDNGTDRAGIRHLSAVAQVVHFRTHRMSPHVPSDLKDLASCAGQATDACIAVKGDPIMLERLPGAVYPCLLAYAHLLPPPLAPPTKGGEV